MYCDTWPPQDDLKSAFESQSTTGSFPFLEEAVPFRGRAHRVSETTQALRDQHEGWKPPFCRSWVFYSSGREHFASWKALGLRPISPGGTPWVLFFRKRPTSDALGLLSTALWLPSCPPTQLPPRSNACTLGAWETHPKIVWPRAKTASEVAHLISHCQLAQYLTSVEMAVCWLDSLVKNVSTAPFNNLECPLEKAKLMWFFYLKKLRNIAAANSIITLSCQQQFSIFFSPEGYNTFAPWGSFFSLHLKTVPQTLPLFITARSPAEIGTFVLL